MHKEGTDVKQLFMQDGKVAVTSLNSKTGERYLALFNIGDKESAKISVDLATVGITGKYKIKELWNGKVTKGTMNILSADIAPHASKLYSITK